MHLFADISSHGFGHFAISAPVLVAVAEMCPNLQLTVRSGLPLAKLRERIPLPFQHIAASSDFGFRMRDATRVDLAASLADYRAVHANWRERVAAEADLLRSLRVDRVLSNVSYLPLAGAAQAGIPAMAICSLNWADLFAHLFAGEPGAADIHAQILAAYRSAKAFMRITPGMPMPDLGNLREVGVISVPGQRRDLGLGHDKAVLLAMGGIAHRISLENWPRLPGVRWIVPQAWQCQHPDAVAQESFSLGFTDLLCSVDAVITKPGYGTFTEAAVNGVPVLFQRRENWPEQACLIEWLGHNARCREIAVHQLENGNFTADLSALWQQTAPPRPANQGARQAAKIIVA
ncbi:MAG: hypothetical protein LWW81_01850 [Rhodocyclales bacterium]|nr:hypothetical protein [Rhodocyclales bacterium]